MSSSGRPRPTLSRPWLIDRRTFLRRAGLLGLTVGAGGKLLIACAPEDPEVAPDADDPGDPDSPAPDVPTDILRIRVVQDIERLDPAFAASTVDAAVLLCVTENLITFDRGNGEIVNELAEEFESSDDGLTHEFRLREGIPFHKGYGEVTAEDVKFSFERIAGMTDPVIEATYRDDWAALEGVEVIDDYRGVIRLSEPFAPLMATTLPVHAGMIISRAAWEDLGDDFAISPVGSGPYEFDSWERGELIVLRRFEDWGGAALGWAEEPQWEEIRLRPITDDSAADVAVEVGEVDFGLVSHAAVDRFEGDDRFEVTRQTTLDYAWIGFNVTDDVVGDVEVRRAIRQALDIDSMIEAAFEGHTTRAHALIAPGMPLGHWEGAPAYEPDPDAARAILDDAGYDQLDVEMSIVEEPGARVIAEIVQSNLAEIGVNVDIRLRERAEMNEQLDALQVFYYSFSNQADPSWATVWFTTAQVGEWNFMSWSNEEFDRLHEQAMVEMDEGRRHDMYVRMQEIMDEDAVAAWVMYRTHHYAHNRQLEPSMLDVHFGRYRPWDIRHRG